MMAGMNGNGEITGQGFFSGKEKAKDNESDARVDWSHHQARHYEQQTVPCKVLELDDR